MFPLTGKRLTQGDVFNVNFSLDYPSLAMVSLYVSSTPDVPSPKANFKAGYKNCYSNSLGGFADCGTQGSFEC